MLDTHRILVRVAGEVDLCGSLVDFVTRLSACVVQDELVSYVAQNLVCHSCRKRKADVTPLTRVRTHNANVDISVPPIFWLVPSTWQEATASLSESLWLQTFFSSPRQTDR